MSHLPAEPKQASKEAAQLEALQSVTAALSAALTSEAVAHAIISVGCAAIGARSGSLGLLDSSGTIRLVDQVGLQESVVERWRDFPVSNDTPMGAVISSGSPSFIESPEDLLATFPHLGGGELTSGSWAGLPIVLEGRSIGALVFGFDDQRRFNDDERRFLISLGQQCSIAMERANLFEMQRIMRLQAEEERERARFLADATKLLNESLELAPTLDALARCAVPRMADWCAIHLLDSKGTATLVAVAHEDPAMVAMARQFVEDNPPSSEDEGASAHVARTGVPRVLTRVTDEMVAASVKEEHRDVVAQLKIRSSMTVPLVVEGKSIGAVTLISSRGDRLFDEGDLEFAQDFASRAAIAISHARLYENRNQIAQTLQQSLLPPNLPTIPGLQMAAAYHAAAEGHDVGGDFYDVFRVGKSSWAVVMGDVCGKDAEAAAVTALARYTVRASAMQARKPARILSELNDAIMMHHSERFVTVVVSVFTIKADGVKVTLASGGHPLPIVVRADGNVEWFGKPGTLVGAFPSVRVFEVTTVLRPDDSILFYTDGCTEARSPLGEVLGEDGLLRLAGQTKNATPEQLVNTVTEGISMFTSGRLSDDVALLALRLDPPPQ